ncbi:MAG: NAD(P)-dependent alcohol dehydrogenase [Actinomycetia bacterium]|nr:NAD(P)-dependent alcohol dehydrogenase [Actinomycetes bacterium]
MTAVTQRSYGSVEELSVASVERPVVDAEEVLIEVHAAGVDRGVWHLMTGLPYLVRISGFGLSRPKQPVPGLDVAGRVVAIGSDVTRFVEGDEVFGIADGAFAEYATASEIKLAHKPANLTFEQAAVATISGITALQALTEVSEVGVGQDVLIIGASGGVGVYAVQLARALGAEVTGVANASKADFVRSLGADDVIDYAAGDYLDGSRTFDLILDIGGRNSLRRLRRALKSSGTLVIVGGEGGNRWTGGFGRQLRALALSPFVSQRLTMLISEEHHRWIDRLCEFLVDGSVVPVIDRAYRLDAAHDALTDLAEGRVSGKAVISVRSAAN